MKSNSRLMRRVIAAVGGLGLAVSVSACGSSGTTAAAGGDGEGGGKLNYWTQQDPTDPVLQAAVDSFNAADDADVELQAFASNGYKDKVRAAMGSSEMPGMFFNWGGGSLDDYTSAGLLVDLGEAVQANPELESSFLPSVLEIGKVDGTLVGVPMRGTQPVFIFYNKQVLADAGIEPPATYADLEAAVATLSDQGVTPFAVAGNADSGWTELMWVSYLVDRIGGPEVFERIRSGDASGWQDPAVLQAAEEIRSLVDSGAFGTNFQSVSYGSGGTSTLLSSGKAAMQLMGSWEYATQVADSPEFAAEGLGWVPFPAYEGGKGDPANVVGNPSNYISVTTSADRATAFDFLETTYSEEYVQGLVDAGEVPVTTNAEELLASAPNPDYAQFQYDLVADAPAFTQSWDQALGLDIGTPLITEIQKLFNGQSTPEQFVSAASALQ